MATRKRPANVSRRLARYPGLVGELHAAAIRLGLKQRWSDGKLIREMDKVAHRLVTRAIKGVLS